MHAEDAQGNVDKSNASSTLIEKMDVFDGTDKYSPLLRRHTDQYQNLVGARKDEFFDSLREGSWLPLNHHGAVIVIEPRISNIQEKITTLQAHQGRSLTKWAYHDLGLSIDENYSHWIEYTSTRQFLRCVPLDYQTKLAVYSDYLFRQKQIFLKARAFENDSKSSSSLVGVP